MLNWLHTTARLLTTSVVGRAMESHTQIDSTNVRALEWASQGAPHGATVIAEKQTAGRGRYGRPWVGGDGESLLFSVVVRPAVDPGRFGLIPLAAGLAVRDACESLPGLPAPRLKWPNDLLVQGRKCAGVLVESVIPAGAPPWAVVGIGLNVNQTGFPDPVADRATSLRLASGRPIARPLLFAELLASLEERLNQTDAQPEGLVEAYLRALHGIDNKVLFRHPDGTESEGILRGISASGALRVERDGREEVFSAGEISLSGIPQT